MRLEANGIRQGYGQDIIIDDIDLVIESGEAVTILGPNGCGKSTLIKTICNILQPKAGTVSIDGKDIKDMDGKELGRTIGYMPQSTTFFGNSMLYDYVLIGRRPYVEWSYSKEDINIAADAMVKLGIDHLYDREVSTLSGGQLQRAALARTLTQDPKFYIFDEPTSALDLRNQLVTLKLMESIIKEKNVCMLMAMHDLNLALRYSDKVMVLKDGKIYGFGPTEEIITTKMIRDVYGVESEIVTTGRGKCIYALDGEDLFSETV
jgi:iron complex transport system ATP-binding protein